MNKDFPCMPVKVLFSTKYYDGIMGGICEYNGEKLYFDFSSEDLFKFKPTNDIQIDDSKDEYDYHRLRIFTVYRLPQEQIDILIHNNELWEEYKFVDGGFEWYDHYKKDVGWTNETFHKQCWQYAIGYTTEDIWDIELYNLNKRRFL